MIELSGASLDPAGDVDAVDEARLWCEHRRGKAVVVEISNRLVTAPHQQLRLLSGGVDEFRDSIVEHLGAQPAGEYGGNPSLKEHAHHAAQHHPNARQPHRPSEKAVGQSEARVHQDQNQKQRPTVDVKL